MLSVWLILCIYSFVKGYSHKVKLIYSEYTQFITFRGRGHLHIRNVNNI